MTGALFLFGDYDMTREGMKAGRDQERQQAAPEEEQKKKSRASMIIDGEIEPEPRERGLLNLRKRVPFNQMEPEKAREIRRKGAEAINKLHGEKKTAKQALEQVLTLKIDDDIVNAADIDPKLAERIRRSNPDATLYDLIQVVAVGRALDGNIKAAEYIRDTHGDAPIKQIEVTENITTDADREMLRQINERLQQAETVQIVEAIPAAVPDDKEGGEIMTPDNDSMTE